ncbi:hypothetical protein ACP70R_030838 [Stipagrostis hirtigluma subsp. patula]
MLHVQDPTWHGHVQDPFCSLTRRDGDGDRRRSRAPSSTPAALLFPNVGVISLLNRVLTSPKSVRAHQIGVFVLKTERSRPGGI